MLLNKQQKRLKEAKSLLLEHNKLLDQIHKIQPIKLDKPIHNGFVKYFEFNLDARKRADFAKLKAAFDFCGQTKVFCKTRDFLNKNKQELKPGVKSVRDPRFATFYSFKNLEDQELIIDKFKKYLRYSADIYSCGCHVDKFYKFAPHYEFNYKELLVEKVDDWWLTHYYPVDGELESRVKKIRDKMSEKHYWELLYGNYSKNDWSDYAFEDLKADNHKYCFDLKHE